MSNLLTVATTLVDSLEQEKSGFVGIVDIDPLQLELADTAARARRTCAKLFAQKGKRDYAAAAAEPTTTYERARLCGDRRGLLAELLIGDLLGVSRVAFEMQPLVSHRPQHGADVTVGARFYDVKSASGFSDYWSPAGANGRKGGDNNFLVNGADHAYYEERPGFGGYLCVYFETRDNVPVRAAIFYVTCGEMTASGLRQPATHYVQQKDMSYYSYPISTFIFE